MEAFGLFLWGLAFLALVIMFVMGARAEKEKPGRLEWVYLAVSWLSLPLAVPLLLVRLSPPPGPSMPEILTVLGLLRAMLGVLLALLGLGLMMRALGQRRMPAWVGVTTVVNLLPFLTLVFPLQS
ncbi:MAG TPA: hypothetical protein VNJ09_10780 [Chthonomonadales bacterium]|nr:hypothetical protein [Chthonomonadales bacterium]